jgi:hypothetical protein
LERRKAESSRQAITKNMQRKGIIVIAALVINLLFVVSAVHLIKDYHDLSKMQFNPDIRLKADEQYLRLLCFGELPFHIAVMSFSVIAIWLLRK